MRTIEMDAYMGERERQPDSKWAVSYWHLPGGYDVINASVRVVYFSDEEAASLFESLHKDTEAMASKYSLDSNIH